MPANGMSADARWALIHAPLPVVRILSHSYPWSGTIVNDYFGEHLDAHKKDRDAQYHGTFEGAFARELRAAGVDDDSVEMRGFIESQTRSRRKLGTRGTWS